MSLYPSVRAVRELKGKVQATVLIGDSPAHGVVSVTVESNAGPVMRALTLLKDALETEAALALRGAQEDQQRRGQEALGA